MLHMFGNLGSAPGELSWCSGLCFTPDDEHLLVTESDIGRLSIFSAKTTHFGEFQGCLVEPAKNSVPHLKCPLDVQVAHDGSIAVADWRKQVHWGT